MEINNVGFYSADIMLPESADMEKWAVVACDQFTSQPEYWEKVESLVGDEPSTYRLILPEAGLNDPDVEKRIKNINDTMSDYIKTGIFKTYKDSLIYVERSQSDGRVRHGLVGMIDLEQYDFTPGSGALIRATEGTVLSRIPPRVKVREHAPVELPHIMLLIDDPEKRIIEPLKDNPGEKIYDFDLMMDGGHITGYIPDEKIRNDIFEGLKSLATPEKMEEKYGLKDADPLVFAVGDGNHSLATAKQCYENLKKITPKEKWKDLPARYALVEVVNNHDDALNFEPIHRIVFNTDPQKLLDAFRDYYPDSFDGEGEGHVIRYDFEKGSGVITVPKPKVQLAVGTLQNFLDEYISKNGGEVDYIHGDDVVTELGKRKGNIAFRLPAMGKEQLFKTVMADGVLPRKTFSMGHACDKRYYIEARKITG